MLDYEPVPEETTVLFEDPLPVLFAADGFPLPDVAFLFLIELASEVSSLA